MPRKHVAPTHFNAQASNLCALYHLEHYGLPDEFVGLQNGLQICLLRDGGRGVQRDATNNPDSSRVTHIGLGRGKFDEHGRRIVDCEASLVGAKLGLIKKVQRTEFSDEEFRNHGFTVNSNHGSATFYVVDAKLRDLFCAVVRDDITGSPVFSFPNLITTLYTVWGGQRRILNWAYELFDACHASGPIPHDQRDAVHREIAQDLFHIVERVETQKDYHELAGIRIHEWLMKRIEKSHFEPLNLIDATAVIRQAGNVDYRAWALTALRAELAEQHHFHAISSEEAEKATLRDVEISVPTLNGKWRSEERIIATIQSDDPLVHKYLASEQYGCNAAAVIKKNRKGQVQIFPGRYKSEDDQGKRRRYVPLSFGFLMPFVAAYIRARECKVRGLSIPSWDELISDHGPENLPYWFFYSPMGLMMNGSLTATDIESTALPLNVISSAVYMGFDRFSWRERKQIIDDMKGGIF